MPKQKQTSDFHFNISLSVLNHLGRKLYRNFITVLGEAISNSWDADAKNVWIEIDKENKSFTIKDDGDGMAEGDFQEKFLKIGYSKRQNGQFKTKSERPFIGAKGIGKLALISCAQRVSVFTKTKKMNDYIGGVIDNTGLDDAITNDLTPDEYPLEGLDTKLINNLMDGHKSGTILVFEGASEILRHQISHIRKLLAMSFRFSMIDESFKIHVNGKPITINDLKGLASATEFVWIINGYEDDFIASLSNPELKHSMETSELDISGFIASVDTPKQLKISGNKEERVTIDLFVNGRLREKNIIRRIPTQRIVESYIYGQIHFNAMDRNEDDPFTSSREGVIEGDPNFKSLLEYLQKRLIPKIFNKWDKFRFERNKDGDDENKQFPLKTRKAKSLYAVAREEYDSENRANKKDKVDKWLDELQPDATFNISAYIDCFLSENLIRKYIGHKDMPISKNASAEIRKYKKIEQNNKDKANISFSIRQNDSDIQYLSMEHLSECAEGKSTGKNSPPSLWFDSVRYKPVRDAACHTSLLTTDAKKHLNVIYENIKGRIRNLLKNM